MRCSSLRCFLVIFLCIGGFRVEAEQPRPQGFFFFKGKALGTRLEAESKDHAPNSHPPSPPTPLPFLWCFLLHLKNSQYKKKYPYCWQVYRPPLSEFLDPLLIWFRLLSVSVSSGNYETISLRGRRKKGRQATRQWNRENVAILSVKPRSDAYRTWTTRDQALGWWWLRRELNKKYKTENREESWFLKKLFLF